jgi:hypothetical protein
MAVNRKSLPTNRVGLRFSALAIIYGPALLFLTVMILAYFYRNIPFEFFSRDPTTTAKMHPLTGIQSNMGVLVWWAGGTICLFCHLLLRQAQVGNSLASFFLWSGLLTCILTLDDFFLFHDYFAWRYLRLSQKIIYLAYATFSVWYLIKFRQIILNSNWLLFFVAFAFFGLSVFMDLFLRQWPSPWRFFFEDGFKLIGIVSWSGYLIQTCLQALRATMKAAAK